MGNARLPFGHKGFTCDKVISEFALTMGRFLVCHIRPMFGRNCLRIKKVSRGDVINSARSARVAFCVIRCSWGCCVVGLRWVIGSQIVLVVILQNCGLLTHWWGKVCQPGCSAGQ